MMKLCVLAVCLVLTSALKVSQPTPVKVAKDADCLDQKNAVNNLIELAKTRSVNLLYFVSLLTINGMVPRFSQKGPITVFAPTDEALNALSVASKVSLYTTPVRRLLQYHVVKGCFKSSSLNNEQMLRTLQGSRIRINTYPNGIVTANCVPVVQADNMAQNGVIHSLGSVLSIPTMSALDLINSDPDLSTFARAIRVAGKQAAFLRNGLTAVVPSNEAFEHAGSHYTEWLFDHPCVMQGVIVYNTVPETLCSAGIENGLYQSGLNPQQIKPEYTSFKKHAKLEFTVFGSSMVVNDKAFATETDRVVANGVVHVINRLIVPKYRPFLYALCDEVPLGHDGKPLDLKVPAKVPEAGVGGGGDHGAHQ